MSKPGRLVAPVTTLLIAALISACMTLPRPVTVPGEMKTLEPLQLPPPADVVGLGPTGEDSIEVGSEAMFVSTPMDDSDPLPDIKIKGLSFANASPYDVMRVVLAGTDISFTIRNEAANSSVMRHSVSAVNMSGKLSRVLDQLSDSVGFYWTYKNGVIDVTPDNQFIANLPPSNDVFESLPFMLKTLGATDIFLDKTSRTVAYRATKVAQRKVSSYLDHIRKTRSLIVYDTFIWEVILSDASNMGIQWNKFNASKVMPSSQFALTTSGGQANNAAAIGLGVVYNTSAFALDLLAQFLQSQGTLQNISQPKLMMINGGTAQFRNGVTTNYVSQVGSTTNGAATTTSVTTASVLSGIDLKISGDIFDGTVNTQVQLALNDLQAFNQFTALGTDLKLPQTANREISTVIRSRPRDTIMIAGINIARSQNDAAGLPGSGGMIAAATSRVKSAERSELVIVMRPRVIKFIKEKNAETPAAAAVVSPVTESEAPLPLVKSAKAATDAHPAATATTAATDTADEVRPDTQKRLLNLAITVEEAPARRSRPVGAGPTRVRTQQ